MEVVGPTIFCGATGSPSRPHNGTAMDKALAQSEEPASDQKKKSSK